MLLTFIIYDAYYTKVKYFIRIKNYKFVLLTFIIYDAYQTKVKSFIWIKNSTLQTIVVALSRKIDKFDPKVWDML